MFINDAERNRVINLDNFDCLRLKESATGGYCAVIATRGDSELIIRAFDSLDKDSAKAMYDSLMTAWVHGINVTELTSDCHTLMENEEKRLLF